MSKVVPCVEALAAAVRSIPTFAKKTFVVYSEDELMQETKGLTYPCVGVIYEGMRSIPESGSTAKQGVSCELVASVMLFFKTDSRASLDAKAEAIQHMDDIRKAIRENRSPSGHFWKFQLETPVEGKKGVLVYMQRWGTPIQNV